MPLRVLVTGGARGLGAAIAAAFVADGHAVRTPTRAELDLADPASIRAWLATPAAAGIDVLVNNAGINDIAPLSELTLEHFERTLRVNLTAAMLLIQGLGGAMAKRGFGRIVNVSSVYAQRARPGRAPYSASKAALEALTRTAALELGPGGVLVNAVCPGFVETALTRQNNDPATIAALVARTALGRLAQPGEIAQLVLFLGSRRNSYLTGQAIVADGGFSIQ